MLGVMLLTRWYSRAEDLRLCFLLVCHRDCLELLGHLLVELDKLFKGANLALLHRDHRFVHFVLLDLNEEGLLQLGIVFVFFHFANLTCREFVRYLLICQLLNVLNTSPAFEFVLLALILCTLG